METNETPIKTQDQQTMDLWNVPLQEKDTDYKIMKFNDGLYKVTFLDDGKIVNSEYGTQVLLQVEGVNLVSEEIFKGVWYISINDNKKSLYGQLQTFRNGQPLNNRTIKLRVKGSGQGKRYEIIDIDKKE